MQELELLQNAFTQRLDLMDADRSVEGVSSRRLPLREKLQDPGIVRTIEKVRLALAEVPDARADSVEKARRELVAGTLPMDGKTVADCILLQTILNEFS